jgi:hypothetical protein
LLLACCVGHASAQEESGDSFSGISGDSALSIINQPGADSTSFDGWDSSAVSESPQVVSIGHSNNDFFYLHSLPDLPDAGHLLSFDLRSIQFTRDAEYFLPETKGYTAVGYFVQPTLRLNASTYDLVVEAGGQFLGIAGDDHRLHVNPVFRLEYTPTSWLSLVGGTIYGNLNHGLYEPMYDFDRYFYNNQEDGFQIFVMKDTRHLRFTSDTWINWENFLEPGEAEQEKFTVGSSNRLLLGNEDRKTFQIPFDFVGTHRGGQFSSLDTCLETIFTACTGIDWAFTNHFRFTGLVFGYNNHSNEIHTPYKNGYGLYPMMAFYDKSFVLTAGYWYANRYIASRGSYLFQSVSKYDPAFVQKERNMVTCKWFYSHGPFGMEAQTYYDLHEHKLDFSFGLYLKFNHSFGLLDEKKEEVVDKIENSVVP